MTMSAANQTYKIKGGRTGVLLIHGLCGTPAEMRFVANGLARAGYTVHCPLLAGHGGPREETIQTCWQDWYGSAEEALLDLKRECDTVVVGGLCLGSILSLHLAASHPKTVRGVALFAPTLWLNGWAIPWYTRLFELVRFRWMARLMHFPDVATLGIKCPRVREFVTSALAGNEDSNLGTTGTPACLVLEHRRMVRAAMARLGCVRQPALIMHSREDDHADLNNTSHLQRRLGGTVDTVVLDDSYHMITLDKQRHVVVERTRAFIERLARPEPSRVAAAAPITTGMRLLQSA
jgi:carboxylesterase